MDFIISEGISFSFYTNGLIVWIGDVPNSNNKYVAFFNRNDENNGTLSVRFEGLKIKGNYSAKNLWSKKTTVISNSEFSVEIALHASAIFRFIKQ